MKYEEEIEKSEEIRKKMNESIQKSLNLKHIVYPFFHGKPAFYFEIGKRLTDCEINGK